MMEEGKRSCFPAGGGAARSQPARAARRSSPIARGGQGAVRGDIRTKTRRDRCSRNSRASISRETRWYSLISIVLVY